MLAVVLYILVQEDAILNERETFDVADIHRVAKQKMALVQPMLEALRKNDEKKIEEYSDITTILPEQFSDENWSKRVASVPERKESTIGIQTRLRKDLLPALWNMGIPPEKAEKIIEKVIHETKTRDIKELTRKIWAMALQNENELLQDAQSGESDPDDLRGKADYEMIDKARKLDGDAW